MLKQKLLEVSPCLARNLISMYSKCGLFLKAREVLESLPTKNEGSWNALIAGYAQQGKTYEALDCLERMQIEGLFPNAITYTSILKTCGRTGAIEKGKQIHDEIWNRGLLKKDVILGTAIVDMYAKCGLLAKAANVLRELPTRDVFSWSALIAGYARQGQGHDALDCFQQMQNENLYPDRVTLASVLKACGSIGDIEKGEEIHLNIARNDLLVNDIVLGNALVDMYVKCGALEKAQEVLQQLPTRNVITWSSLISGYAKQGQGVEALSCVQQMQSEGLLPNTVTFICILKACGFTKNINKGKKIHNEILDRGLLQEGSVELSTALVDMYVKCDAFTRARKILQELSGGHIAPWNAMIGGYVQRGHCTAAISCYNQMCSEGGVPDSVTFIGVVKACGSARAIETGKVIHEQIMNRRFMLEKDVILGTALVDMYVKCGMLAKAEQVFEELPVRNVVSWNALMAGFVQEGLIHEALNSFERMQKEGTSPDRITFQCVLKACYNSGLLNQAQVFYGNMSKKYNITPDLGHHICMVTGFGHSGEFGKMMSVMMAIPSYDHPAIWLTLLDACRIQGNVNLGKLAFDQVLQTDDGCAAAYVIMADIFINVGMQEDAQNGNAIRFKCAALKK